MQADVRERILETASKLFYQEGTRAVGVDLIVARSGVAKTSLYRHFSTKDQLIEAFLTREDQDFWRQWDEVATHHLDSPLEELLAQLRWLGERVARPGYRGCPQINIAAEYSDETHPARRVAVEHKQELRRRLASLGEKLNIADPQRFALKVALVIDGALSSRGALNDVGPVDFLQEFAQTILAAEKRKGG